MTSEPKTILEAYAHALGREALIPLRSEQPGSELTCPTSGCGLRLLLNPFLVKPLKIGNPLLGFLRK